MSEVRWRRDSDFEPRRRNDFETSRGAEVRRDRSVRIVLPGEVIAILLDEDDVRRDDRRHIVGLAGSRLVDRSHPTLQPTALTRRVGCGRPALSCGWRLTRLRHEWWRQRKHCRRGQENNTSEL